MEILNPHINEKPKDCNTVHKLRDIADQVCEKYGLTLPLLRGNRRLGPISAARFEYYYRAANETNKCLSEIGNFLKVDHTTVSYGMTRYQLRFNLPPPRGYRFRSPRKAMVNRFYPLDIMHCDERTLRQVQRLDQELRSNGH